MCWYSFQLPRGAGLSQTIDTAALSAADGYVELGSAAELRELPGETHPIVIDKAHRNLTDTDRDIVAPHPAPRTPHASPRTPHASPRTPHAPSSAVGTSGSYPSWCCSARCSSAPRTSSAGP